MKSSQNKKIFLAIETTTDIFSVAIGNREQVLGKKEIEARRHSEHLLPAIDEILRNSGRNPVDLDAVGAGRGPGSFTGIRVGLSVAVTMAQVLDIPLYGISYMDIAGRKVPHPIIRAYRDKFYYAGYDKTGARQTPYTIIDENRVQELGASYVKVEAEELLGEIDKMYKEDPAGDWRRIEPVYVMETEYKTKEQRNNNGEKK